jgi:hypothetical protein
MKRKNQGFSLYLTFLVTTVIFILVTGSYEIGRISLDLGRSTAIDVILFHAADGGLERGLAKVRKEFTPFNLNYKSNLQTNRNLKVEVCAVKKDGNIDLTATATLFEGNKKVATKCLKRQGVKPTPGRTNTGNFMEAI